MNTITISNPSQIKGQRVKKEVEKLIKKGVKTNEIQLVMSFICDAPELIINDFRKLKNQIAFNNSNIQKMKINKLYANWDIFRGKVTVYITTFENNVKRALKYDEQGYFFILNKEKNYITEQIDINRINNFINF